MSTALERRLDSLEHKLRQQQGLALSFHQKAYPGAGHSFPNPPPRSLHQSLPQSQSASQRDGAERQMAA
jgi:hypothetical protein